MDRVLLDGLRMDARALVLISLDAASLTGLLAVLADAAAHRGDDDLRGALQLAQRQAERVSEGLEAFTHSNEETPT